MKLSILMPVYNEIATIADAIAAVENALIGVSKELIIVDDGSSDGTRKWLEANFDPSIGESELSSHDRLRLVPSRQNGLSVRVILHDRNKGKGGAIQTAIKCVTGDVIVIQDADLEYDPTDWVGMYELIALRKVADVVYGSRFQAQPHRSLYYYHYCGNRLISLIFNILFNQTLSDVEVGYKMFSRDVLKSLKITQNDFGFEIQISAQIAKARKWRIYETGIHYYGRTYAEGKKITWRDGVKALWYLFKFRVTE